MSQIDDFLNAGPESSKIDDFLKDAPAPGRSAIGEIANQGYAGVVSDLPEMVGKAAQYSSEEGQPVYEWGKKIADAAKARGQAPDLQADPDKHNGLTNILAQGARMIPQSIAPAAVVGGALAAAPAAIPGAAILGASAVLGSLPAAMSQGQTTLDKAREAGVADDVAIPAARKTAAIEGLGEAAGTYLGGKLLGVGGKAISTQVNRSLGRAAGTAAGDVLEDTTGRAVLKPFLKQLPETMIGEVGTEMGQNAGQAYVEQQAGIDKQAPWEAAKEAVGPTVGMTLLLAPFGLAGHGIRAVQNGRRADTLSSAEADPQQRAAIADGIQKQLAKVDAAAAENFGQHAIDAISTKSPLSIGEHLFSAPDYTAQSDAANADLGTAVNDYTGMPSETAPLQLESNRVIAVPRQDGMGMAPINRDAGPLSDAAADAQENGLTASMNQQVGPLLKSYATAQEAEADMMAREDADRLQVGRHPRATDRFSVLPKSAVALAAQDAKASLAAQKDQAAEQKQMETRAANETRTQQAEQEDGNAMPAGAENAPTTIERALLDSEQNTAQAIGNSAPTAINTVADTVDEAAHQAATSELNDRPQPTDAQKSAGNYAKGHIRVGGLDMAIENPVGSTRSGTDTNGKPWTVTMGHHYGYVKATTGNDKDQVDTFVKRGTSTAHAGPVFVVDQVDPATGRFDEHKAMVGFSNEAEAVAAYKSNYAKGWTGMKAVTAMSMDQFKTWVKDGPKRLPASQDARVQEAMASAKAVAAENAPQAAQAVAEEAAQAEVRQSVGKKSLPRMERIAGETNEAYVARRAEAANTKRAERVQTEGIPTQSKDTAAAIEALGDRATGKEAAVPTSEMPDQTDAKEGEISKQSAAFINHVSKLFGKRVVFVSGMSADGMRTAGNVIYLSTQSSVAHLRVLGHEMLHALKAQKGDAYAKMLEAVKGLLTDEVYAAEYKNYHGKPLAEGTVLSESEKSFLAEEWLADLSGNRFAEADFWHDVFAQIEDKYGAPAAKGIIARLRMALVSALNQLMKLVSGPAFAADSTVQDHLAEVRKAIADGFAAYAQAVKTGDLDSEAGVSGESKFSGAKDSGRVGSVSTHVLAAQRDERTTTDKTRVSKGEAAIIRDAAKKMGKTIGEVEEMVRDNKGAHPASEGWAQLVLTGVKVDDDGKGELQYQTIPYSFSNGGNGTSLTEGTPEYTAKVSNISHAMLREVRSIYERAKGGDVAAGKIIAQSGWYKEMRTRLRQEFGGMGDLFADLLGATSPNTPVRTNWDNSIMALRLATQGEFDTLLPKWVAWARDVDSVNTQFRARFDSLTADGMNKAQIKNDPEYQWLAARAAEIREFPDNLLPVKDNGKKFGFNGKNVVRALIDLWRVVKNADPDINVGGTAPKAINFSGNLIGFRARATIDVWAARMLQRMAGGLRIPSMAEGGVTGDALESGRNTLQFGFGQDVFGEAVRLIRSDLELSEDPVLRSINDDDLQALVWFIEKEVWTKGNWTSAAGEGGSFEFESDLAGITDRDTVNEQRKIADSSVARSAAQTTAAQDEIARLTGLMAGYGRIPAANSTLEANAAKVADKTNKLSKEQKDDIRAGNVSAREILKAEKDTKAYKDLQRELNKQKGILKKPTTEQRAQMRADAVGKLGEMSRTVDRFTAGISLQKGAEQGMDPTPPTDAEMAQAMDDIAQAAAQGDPGATIVGLKVIATEGRYGSPERAIDLEVITTDNFDPRPMAAKVFEVAEQADQDAAFVARVLRPDEEFDPLVHRPGIELYFRDMNQAQEAARMMAEIPNIRVSKPSEFGPNFFGIGGYTVVVDGRPSASGKAGQMGKPVGMRVMYLPEFEARYGMDSRLENATDSELSAIVEERAKDLRNFADEVLRKFDGVSFAGRFNYEVDTRFAGEYQGAINGYSGENNLVGEGTGKRQSGPWGGRSNRESIAAATGRLQVDGRESGAELPSGNGAQTKLSPQRAGSPALVDGQGGPGARAHAVSLSGVHFSQQARTNLDGRYYGTGLKGAERARLANSTDQRIKERVYFYVDEGNGIRPESGVGAVAHAATLGNLYNVTGDPAGIFKSRDDNANESALLDAGYDGYYVPKVFNNQGVAVVLGKASRGISVAPTGYGKGTAPAAAPEPYKRALMGSELSKLDMDALQAAAPSAKLRMGNLTMDAAELPAARTELAKQGIELPEAKFSAKRAPTDSPAFKKWFGEDSTLVNADGSPMVLYHGTTKQNERALGVFRRSKIGAMGPAIYLGDSKEASAGYADGAMMEVYARGKYLNNRQWTEYVNKSGWAGAEQAARADGFSGVYDSMFENAIAVWDSQDIKSATKNNGKFDPANPDIRFSEKRTEPFYSALSQEVSKLKMQTAPAFGWRDAIKGLVNKGLVKAEEIEWSGLNDWLELQTGKVTRDQVVQYLDANGVKVTETTLGSAKTSIDRVNREIEPEGYTAYEDKIDESVYFIDPDGDVQDYADLPEYIQKMVDKADGSAKTGPAKFEQYVVPGGENYREVLLTLPDGKNKEVLEAAESDTRIEYRWAVKNDSPESEQDALKAKLDAATAALKSANASYTSSHWDQKNVLAHIRLDDRTDADGNKVLFVQELQSDWGQQAKKDGVKGAAPTDAQVREYFGLKDGADPAEYRQEMMGSNKKGVPNAPFIGKTEGWLNLALKRVIKMAVDGGYQKVAFANGEQNAKHYDLSKEMDTLLYDSGDGSVIGRKDGGNVITKTVNHSSEIADLVGKDIAERLLKSPKNGYGMHELKGLELKMGGEGMKTFYDKIVPIAAGKLAAKLGGGKVEPTTIYQSNGFEGNERKASAKAVTSEQPSITITDKMRENAADGLPMFSKKRIVGDQGRAYTADQLKAFDNVGFRAEDLTLKERMQAVWKDAGKKLAQGIADQFAPVKDLDGKAYGLLRLAKGAAGAFESLLKGGQLKLSDGVYDFDASKKGGVIDRLLKPLQGEHHDFLKWVAANRAERLMAQGKEVLFTKDDIAAIKTLATGRAGFTYKIQNGIRKGQTTSDRAAIYQDSLTTFNEFNTNVLDMAEQSGLIDGASRHLWEHEFYVPFYRVAEEADGGVRGMNIKGAAVRQQAFKALKGGKDKLNADLLDNTLMNWSHLLDASAKNRAAKATIEAAEKAGVAMGGNQTALASMGSTVGNKNGVVWFMDGGQKRYSLIDNQGDGPYIMTALTSLEYAGMRNPVMNAMGAMKHALTVGVTASPFFKVRNLIRDSVQVIGTGPISYNVGKNLVEGWKLTDPKSDAYFRLLAGGGTIHFGTMMEGSEAKRVQALVESGIDAANILDSDQKVKAFYRNAMTAYSELGNRGEAVNRASLYDQLIKGGMSHAEASLQARDLMDFSMAGSFTSVRFLTQVVPFMNARIQGLYKLGKAAKEDPARFSIVLGATALASLSLLAAYHDDDDWKKRTDSDRNNFWWFKFAGKAFRIPKPFEIGSIGTLAERGFELAFEKEMTSERFGSQVMAILGDQLSMNPIPQLVKPMLDVYANKNSFTGSPIENMAQQKLKSEYRFNDKTTMAARALGTANNAVTGLIGKEGLSPVQIDAMLQGYFGWLGTMVVSAGDYLARPGTGQPAQAREDYLKKLTGNIASDLRDAPSRYVGQMYEQAKSNMEAYDTWRALIREQKPEDAKAFFESNKKPILDYHKTEAAKKSETLFNNMMRMVERNRDLDPDQKREKIRAIQAQKEAVARRAVATQ